MKRVKRDAQLASHRVEPGVCCMTPALRSTLWPFAMQKVFYKKTHCSATLLILSFVK